MRNHFILPQGESEEIWAVFPEYPTYSASNLGRVKNNKTGRIVKGHLFQKDYLRIKLGRNGKTVGIHYIVLSSFVPKPDGDYYCDHIDRNTLNNKLENLRWVSRSQNILNSDYRTFYCFLNGVFLTEYQGWNEAGEALGVNPMHLRKRMNRDWCMKSRCIPGWKGYYLVSKKKFHQTYNYIW